MTRIPDYTKNDLGTPATGASVAPAAGESWLTPEGIPVQPVYTGAATSGLDFLGTWPGIAPFLRAGGKEGPARLGVQDDHAVVGKDGDDARLQRLDLSLVKKAEADPGADLAFLPEGIRRDREPGNALAPVHPGGLSVLHPYLLAER